MIGGRLCNKVCGFADAERQQRRDNIGERAT
jgi:hypothetical protein